MKPLEVRMNLSIIFSKLRESNFFKELKMSHFVFFLLQKRKRKSTTEILDPFQMNFS